MLESQPIYGALEVPKDAEGTIDIAQDTTNPTQAVISIDDVAQFALDYHNLANFIAQCTQVLHTIEWEIAEWIEAKGWSDQPVHLMRKGQHDPEAKTLCGKRPPALHETWDLTPIVGEPWDYGRCKTCLAISTKARREAAREEDHAPQH